jgi:hypothetical protein
VGFFGLGADRGKRHSSEPAFLKLVG